MNQLTIFYLLKVIGGIAYIYIHQHYYNGGDTWLYFHDTETIASSLAESPFYYLFFTFGPNALDTPPAFAIPYIQEMGFWYDTAAYSVIRLNAVLYLFTLGHFYAYASFTAFISFTGLFFIYKAFSISLTYSLPKMIGYAVFLFPSTLYWTSGAHKEVIIILALGILIYYSSKITLQQYSFKDIIWILLSVALIGCIRFYLLLILFVPWMSYYLVAIKKHPKRIYLVSLLTVSIGIVVLHFFLPEYSPLKLLVNKQQQFLVLKGNSTVELRRFGSSIPNLIKTIPDAVNNVFVKPYPTQLNTTFKIIYGLENYFIISLIVYVILLCGKNLAMNNKFFDIPNIIMFMLTFSILTLIIIGLVVPNLGAIARYKSITTPFLLPCLILLILYKNPKVENK